MMCGVTFSKYFEWEDGIQCQKSNLTKFSPVRFLKFGQIQFLTLDSISPVKTLGKIHPRSTTFKLAQKSCRKRPAAQISKSVYKERVQLYRDKLNFLIWCVGWLFPSIFKWEDRIQWQKSNLNKFLLSDFWNLVRFNFWHWIRSPQSKYLEKFTPGPLLSS